MVFYFFIFCKSGINLKKKNDLLTNVSKVLVNQTQK